MASMKDVARLAGVGMGTVSRVLNDSGYVSKDVRIRVNEAVKALNYTPNHNAQSLKTQKNKLVGLFVPTIDHPFFSQIAQHIESMLDEAGYKLMLVCSQDKVEKENNIIRLIAQNRMDGAIFFTHQKHDDISPEYPIVTMDRHLGEHIPCVTSDNYEASHKAVEYLLEHGCKKLAYFGGQPAVESEVFLRLQAYRDVMKEHGLEQRVMFEVIAHGDEDDYADKFFEKFGDCDGVFVSGDVLALKLYYRVLERGIKIPEEFKIISFDGVLSKWVERPKFTVIRQDLAALSRAITEQLINKINQEQCQQKIIIPSEFIIGETT